MKKLNHLCLGFVVYMFTSHAGATTFDIDSSLGNDLYLNSATTGLFDITSQLSPANSYVSPYLITGASVAFSFTDDANDPTMTSERYTAYTPTAITSRLHVVTLNDPSESASLNLGGQSASGNTTYYSVASHLTGVTTDWSYYANNCPGYTGACNHQLFQGSTHTYEEAAGYKGDFTLGYVLNTNNLSVLANTGILNFNLGVTGDLILKSAKLTLDITENSASITSPVPEPETYAMLLVGLGFIGFFVTRNRYLKIG